MIDIEAIASTLYRMRARQEQLGSAQITVDPASTEPAASLNRNRIYLCGRAGGLTYDELIALINQFDAKAVKRAFVWLSPGPDLDTVREWLRALGLVKVTWTRYPTLLRSPGPMTASSAFEIRRVDRDEVSHARERFGLVTMAGFEASLGRDGFHHYMAYEAGWPVASAALVQFEDIGYLTYALTSEPHRRRGAQQALIARRVNDAAELGCAHVISQTLTMLKSSFANLQRCGFREIYEQEVYERCVDSQL